ncbi:MAG: tRNA (adenosine(37)-N6)-threonylcarbamoyltransferase complex ATPase subunit type 1 TsaE [Acidimicrobiia bacterium]
MPIRRLSDATIERLPSYLRALRTMDAGTITSEQLAAMTGVNSAKVRKDLSHFGFHGTRGVGYDVRAMRSKIERELGVTETVISPTFVIMKEYAVPNAHGFTRLTHIDAYRLNSHIELERLGWQELLADPQNLIIIEWPERVPESIPKNAKRITLSHKSDDEREILFEE